MRELQAVLEAGPAAWGWDEDQCWTLTRIAVVIRSRFSRWIEHQTGWSIRKFVKTARLYRTIEIQDGDHVITAADPIPDDLRAALTMISNARRP